MSEKMIRYAALSGPWDNLSDGEQVTLFTSPQKAQVHINRVSEAYRDYARVVKVMITPLGPQVKVEPLVIGEWD